MKDFTFLAWCSYGKGDSGESWIDVELTDEDADRLVTFGTQAEIYYKGFSECAELKDIYERIYAIAVKQMTEELKEFGDLDEPYRSDPNWKVDDRYPCEVNFPSEFEEMLVEEDEAV